MSIGKLWNSIVKGISWLLIQVVAVLECYLIAFLCTGTVTSAILIVCHFIPSCSVWVGWVFNHYSIFMLLLNIPVTLFMFIYLQVIIHPKAKVETDTNNVPDKE